MLQKSNPEHAKLLWDEAQQDVDTRYRLYEYLAQRKPQPAAAALEKQSEPVALVEAGIVAQTKS
jgi:hypothetical protein